MKRNKFLDFFKSPIGILLLIGFVVRICLFFMYMPGNHLDEVVFSDAKGYQALAVNFLKTFSYNIPHSDLDTIRPPLYPLFLSICYFIFGIHVGVPILIQQVIVLVSVFILYKIGTILFSKKIGMIAAIILCFEPDHIFYSFELMTDTLFVFIFLLSVYLFIKFLKTKKLNYLIISSLLLGLSVLDRPISIFIPIVFIFILGLNTYLKKGKWMGFAKYSAIILSLFLIVLAPWLIRNKECYDSYGISSITGHNLLDYNVAYTIKTNSDKPADEIIEDLYDQCLLIGDSTKMVENPFYESNIKTKVALDYIKQHKFEYIKSNLIGVVNLYSIVNYKVYLDRFFRANIKYSEGADYSKVSGSFSRIFQLDLWVIIIGFANFFYLIISYILAFIGGIRLLKEKEYLKLLSILSFIAYFTVLTGVVGLVARYKLPISPFYILLVSVAIVYLVDKRKKISKQV